MPAKTPRSDDPIPQTLQEAIEFFATILVPETNVGGYLNTGWDLVANAVGVTIAAVIIGARSRRLRFARQDTQPSTSHSGR